MTAVVTAVYGNSDIPYPQVEQNIPVEWLCFTDDPTLTAPAPWQVIVVPATHQNPRIAAKVHKMTPAVDHADVVWVDASHQVTARSFVREALKARRQGFAAWKHPRRRCIFAEADACVGHEAQGGKYDPVQIAAQIAAYRTEGHPEQFGLYACGVLALDLADERVRQLGAAWLTECLAWSSQDQLSLPVVCRRMGITPGTFPLRQIARSSRQGWLENRWLRVYPHLHQNPENAVDATIG